MPSWQLWDKRGGKHPINHRRVRGKQGQPQHCRNVCGMALRSGWCLGHADGGDGGVGVLGSWMGMLGMKCPGMGWELGAVPWVRPVQVGEAGGTHPHCHCWHLHHPSPISFPTGLGTSSILIPSTGLFLNGDIPSHPACSLWQLQGENPSPDNILGQNKQCVTDGCFAPGPTAMSLSGAVAFHDKLFPSFHHLGHCSPLLMSPQLGARQHGVPAHTGKL